MNWINYSEQKPSPEPKRQVWVRTDDGLFHCIWVGGFLGLWSFNAHATHWAEIEPPWEPPKTEPTEFDRQMAKLPRTKEEMGPYLLKLGAIWKKEADERKNKP